jgi:hypothetical protein
MPDWLGRGQPVHPNKSACVRIVPSKEQNSGHNHRFVRTSGTELIAFESASAETVTWGADAGRRYHYQKVGRVEIMPGMKERARHLGGKLAVWSELDSATDAELTVPASIAYARTYEATEPMASRKGS